MLTKNFMLFDKDDSGGSIPDESLDEPPADFENPLDEIRSGDHDREARIESIPPNTSNKGS